MGCQCGTVFAILSGDLDVRCHDILCLHVTHKDVHLDVVSKAISYREL
jgi:hypothetical protein